MALKIRLKRMGNRNRPFYRLVVQESTWRRDGKTVADVGWYDVVKQPAQLSFKEKEIYQWLEKGVQMTDTARSLLKRHGLLAKFKSGEYKQVLESEDAPASVQFTLSNDEAPEKPVQAPAPTQEPEAEAAPEEPKEEESAETEPAAEETPTEEPAEAKEA